MKLFFIPVNVSKDAENQYIFLHREGEPLQVFMHHAEVQTSEYNIVASGGNTRMDQVTLHGEFTDGQSFDRLQDGDVLLFTVLSRTFYASNMKAFNLEMFVTGDMLMPFKCKETVLSIAAGMETAPSVFVIETKDVSMLQKAKNVYSKAKELYKMEPEYQHIMLRDNDRIITRSLLALAAEQPEKIQSELTALFLAMSSVFKTVSTIATTILKHCEFKEGFSLMTQEEQVSSFIEFSKMAASRKKEYVSDQMIEQISASPEYERTKEVLAQNGLGISKTQQFNVFQQVGYFSSWHEYDILYNLSDMGAGKTLMTVEAIYLLDLKQISNWIKAKDEFHDILNSKIVLSETFWLPDKHIIAPTLSVKSSWIDTFRLFYNVEEVGDMVYELTISYKGVTAKSRIYVAPFTVKNGKIFVQEKLPAFYHGTYLIIDEIHQLVNQNISRTKFFPPKTTPATEYKTFILSGTMSNLKTRQWFHFMRFMGIQTSSNTSPQEIRSNIADTQSNYYHSIKNAAKEIKTSQHRYFDTDTMTLENAYRHEITRKITATEENFFTTYSSQIIVPKLYDNEVSVEDLLIDESAAHSFTIVSDPLENDAINFNLFYDIVGSKAITAQSVQIAEELFGEQKKQHVSDIIKTVSPLSPSDIQILKTLHHIAEDHNQYKSVVIAKAINNAILNLNDGLQTKNIYDIVSGYAERNIRFFEYLSTLDVDILEQLPASGLIDMPKLEDTDKFKVLKDILQREKDETHLIVVNDYYALKSLSIALGIEYLTKDQLKRELDYQEVLDALFEKQSVVIVTQDMIKSSLDLVQANRLIQYQLNTEISDIIQTQNRINRIGQKRETRGYYIASDQLQENLIELFLESYRNIRVAHKGIVELFADITSQINVVNDYLEKAFTAIEQSEIQEPVTMEEPELEPVVTDLATKNSLPKEAVIASDGNLSRAILFPQNGSVMVLVPLTTGNAFPYGELNPEKVIAMNITAPIQIMWNLSTDMIEDEAV